MVVKDGEIQFKNVSFWYKEDNGIFDNLNIHIQPWEKVALVGMSWSGKSTFVKLLFRFFNIQWWEISIDWQDISKVKQDSLRHNISMVPQDPILFHRSIYENIAYGNLDSKKEDIMKVSKMAHCHEFICELPDGYDTLVWERWIKLSWWEKQRVAIARALLENGKIFVLDEATSSLDSESESLIQDVITNAMRWRTTVIIAHRLSTIMKMDRIIVFEKWKIMEEGKHVDLIKKKWGTYKRLWDIQSGGFVMWNDI